MARYSGKGETMEDVRNVRKKLTEKVSGFKSNPDDTSPDRSAIDAIVVGDAKLVLMRIDLQEIDFDHRDA